MLASHLLGVEMGIIDTLGWGEKVRWSCHLLAPKMDGLDRKSE